MRSLLKVPSFLSLPHGSFAVYSRSSLSLAASARIRPFSRPHRLGSFILQRWATATTQHSTASDPAELEALQCLEQGTQKLEEGDVEAAKRLYKRSTEIKKYPGSLFNLGVTHYHLKEYDDAIAVWKEAITLQPSNADAHTNLASAYIVSPVSRPDLALHHLKVAASLSPEDPEIAFNLAAVLEAMGQLDEALVQYRRSKDFGVDRAEIHIRNVSAKLLIEKLNTTKTDKP